MLPRPASSRERGWRCDLAETLALHGYAAPSCPAAAKNPATNAGNNRGRWRRIPAVTLEKNLATGTVSSLSSPPKDQSSVFRLLLKIPLCSHNTKTMKQGPKSINRMTIDSSLSHVICRPVKPGQLATADTPRFLSRARYRRPRRSCCWLMWSEKPDLRERRVWLCSTVLNTESALSYASQEKEKWWGLCLSRSFLVISAASGKNKANKTFINAGFYWVRLPSSHFCNVFYKQNINSWAIALA